MEAAGGPSALPLSPVDGAWPEGGLENGRLATPAAGAGDLYVIASVDASVLDLGRQLRARGARTLTLAPGEGLADLVRRLEAAQQAGGWQRLHLLSHGSDGVLQIGNDRLTTRNLWRHRDDWRQLGSLFPAGGDLLLYGCDLAASAAGQRLVARIGAYTDTDVAASDDPSGSAALGRGDWQLEYTRGEVNLDGEAHHHSVTICR